MIFRTIIQRSKLTACLEAAPVVARKAQDKFVLHFYCLRWNEGRAILRKLSAKHASYVKQRAAPADQACVVGTVTDNVAFSTQDRILERDRIQNPTPFTIVLDIGTLHHRTSPGRSSTLPLSIRNSLSFFQEQVVAPHRNQDLF
jgi:hypothetical protein